MSLVSGKQYSTEITSRKNMIINGNFDVWQRRTTFSSATDSVGAYTADRWYYEQNTTARVTVARSTDIPTFAESGIYSNYSMHFDVTTADTSLTTGEYAVFLYQLEGDDYRQLGGDNATLSFWVKADKTGTYSIRLRNSGSDRFYYTEYDINVANTWEKKIITLPLTETGGTWNYTNGLGLQILWNLALASNLQTGTIDTWNTTSTLGTTNQVNGLDSTANNFRITQVQLEQGTIATDFEKRHFTSEFALCQRYFQKTYDYGTAIGTATRGGSVAGRNYSTAARTVNPLTVRYPVTMRVSPTLTIYSLNGTSGSISDAGSSYVHAADLSYSSAISSSSQNGFAVVSSSTAVPATNCFGFHYTADAEI